MYFSTISKYFFLTIERYFLLLSIVLHHNTLSHSIQKEKGLNSYIFSNIAETVAKI